MVCLEGATCGIMIVRAVFQRIQIIFNTHFRRNCWAEPILSYMY